MIKGYYRNRIWLCDSHARRPSRFTSV